MGVREERKGDMTKPLYVDDMLISCNDVTENTKLKQSLEYEFKMEDLVQDSQMAMEVIRDWKSQILRLTK
ncbi:hypothetical protein LXL04_028637 [Taraxacum kok-saghyz]